MGSFTRVLRGVARPDLTVSGGKFAVQYEFERTRAEAEQGTSLSAYAWQEKPERGRNRERGARHGQHTG
jgi:hypothetical protein